MSALIRRARRYDVAAIQAIYNDSVLHTTASYDDEPQPVEERLRWFDNHEHEGFPIFVAEHDSRVIGWSALGRFRPRAGYRFTAENSIYVHPDWRGRGIGSMLLPPLIDEARGPLGLHSILAVIGDAENKASIRLHASVGFVQVAVLPQVGFKFGRWLDQVWMQLLL